MSLLKLSAAFAVLCLADGKPKPGLPPADVLGQPETAGEGEVEVEVDPADVAACAAHATRAACNAAAKQCFWAGKNPKWAQLRMAAGGKGRCVPTSNKPTFGTGGNGKPGAGNGEKPWAGNGDKPWAGNGDKPWTGNGDKPWAGNGDKPWAGNGDKPGGPEPGDDSTETTEELAGVTPELDEEAPEPAVDAEALAACAQHKKRDACKAAEGSSCFWAGKNPKWKALQADGPGAKCLPKKIKPSKPGMLKPSGGSGQPTKPGMIKPSGEKPAEPGRIDPSMPGGGGSVQEKPVKLCGAAACAADEFCKRAPQKTGGAKTCVKKDPCASTSCATEKADLECVATGASTKQQPLGKRASCMCANQCTSDSCPGNKTCATKMYKSKSTSKYPNQLSLDGKAYSYTCEIKCMGKRRTALFTNKLNAIKDKKGGGAPGEE